MSPGEKLKARLPSIREYPVGITEGDILRIPLTAELALEVLEAIKSIDAADVRLGQFFAEVLPLAELSVGAEIAKVAFERLQTREEWGVREGWVALLARYGRDLAGYRETMLGLLGDADEGVRYRALSAYPTHALEGEISPLLSFESDEYMTEVGMGSDLIFAHRNQALAMIETITGQRFRKVERSARLPDGKIVRWWDWGGFHRWRKSWKNRRSLK